MRSFPFLLISIVSAGWLACSSTGPEDSASSSASITDRELARGALGIMGATEVPPPAGETKSCGFTGCHSINTVTLAHWNDEHRAAMAILESSRSTEEKINYFRQNPRDPQTPFAPERLGFMAAGAHLVPGGDDVSATRNPETYKQALKFAALFQGQDALYAEFREAVKMPVLDTYPQLTAAKYETVLTWFQKGMPFLRELIPEARPTRCVDDFAGLRARTSQVKNKTWAAVNTTRHLPMTACPASESGAAVSPTQCFKQQLNGKDIFPNSADVDFARPWALDGSTVRVLRKLAGRNSYWLRSSADGRFTMTGGGSSGGAQAIDLRATLEGRSRDIGLRASYDPDFWPDNKAFMFQGGTKFCAQSLLEKPTTTLVSFNETECSNLSAASGLYQTVGQSVDDNSMSDRFIVFSDWVGDSGSYSASATDTTPRGGANSSVSVYTAVAMGTDVEQGYQVAGAAFKLDTPYRGDTMMARSGHLLGNRWAYGQAADGTTASGYAIEKLDYRMVGGRYQFNLAPLGTVCMKGNKANFSFDERFFTTHHYNEPSDFTASDNPAYRSKGSADIHVVDFITGRKQKVTKMGPGQFALFPHFRSDGWLYFLVVDYSQDKYYVAASDWAVRQNEATPTPNCKLSPCTSSAHGWDCFREERRGGAAARARGPVIDADQLAREAVAPGSEGLLDVVKAFGDGILLPDGSLDRKKLAAAVFGDDDRRRTLNAIVHPRVSTLTFKAASVLRDEGEALACYEAALIVENGLADAFRPLVVVSAPEQIQIARATARDKSTPDEARTRIRAQMPLADKVAVADHVIENTGLLDDLKKRTDEVLAAICTALNVDADRYE